MTPKTASKYIHSGEFPSAQIKERDWRTRADPFEAIWPDVEAKLKEALEPAVVLEKEKGGRKKFSGADYGDDIESLKERLKE